MRFDFGPEYQRLANGAKTRCEVLGVAGGL